MTDIIKLENDAELAKTPAKAFECWDLCFIYALTNKQYYNALNAYNKMVLLVTKTSSKSMKDLLKIRKKELADLHKEREVFISEQRIDFGMRNVFNQIKGKY